MLVAESSKYVEICNKTPTPCTYETMVSFFKTEKNPMPIDPFKIAELRVYGRKDIGENKQEYLQPKPIVHYCRWH